MDNLPAIDLLSRVTVFKIAVYLEEIGDYQLKNKKVLKIVGKDIESRVEISLNSPSAPSSFLYRREI